MLLVGSTDVGKTSLLYLLLGKDPQYQKFGFCEQIIKVVCINESGEWKELSKYEFQDMIVEAVSVLHEKLNSTGKGIDNLTEVLSHVIGEDILEEKQGKKLGNEPPASADKSHVTISTVVQEITKLFSGVTRFVSGNKKPPCPPDKLLYLTECGGEIAYLDITPVFIYDTTATLFVHRLFDNIDEHPPKMFDTNLKPSLTTAEVFKTMLHEGGECIAVGTHKDLASDCAESMKENNKILASIALSHFKGNPVYLCKDSMKMFQVNTRNPGCDDKKEANKIRACIEKHANLYEIPILWFILWLLLEALACKLGREVLSIGECIRVSNSLGFSEGELDAALIYFDKLNIFLYKMTVLPGVVFTNSEVPLDKLRPVIKKLHHFRADHTKEMNHPMATQWQNCSESGILTLDLLEEFKENYIEEIFTPDDFLMLLENLLVVFQLSKNEYFFPAGLSLLSKAKINSYLKSCRSTNIAALVVRFSTGRAPPGVYCCSVCHLQRYSGWQLVRKPHIKPRRTGLSAEFSHPVLEKVKQHIKPHKVSGTHYSHPQIEEIKPPIKPHSKGSNIDFGVEEVKPPIKPRTKNSSTDCGVEEVKPPIKPRTKNSSTDCGVEEVKPPIKPRTKNSSTDFGVEEVKPPIKPRSKSSTTGFCVKEVKPPTKPPCRSSSGDFVIEVVKPSIKPRSKGFSARFSYPKMEEVKPIIKPRGKFCGTQIPHPRIEVAKPPIKPRSKGCIAQFPHPRMEEVKPPIKPRSKGSSSPQLFPSRMHEVKPLIKKRSKSYSTQQSKVSDALYSPLYRNCLEFTKINRPGSVTFIDHFAFFVVCVNVDTTMMLEDELINHCQAIKSEILEAVKEALVNTHHESTSPTIGFLCPKQDDFCSPDWHVAHISKCNKLWECSRNSAVVDSLTPDQTLWLPETGNLGIIFFPFPDLMHEVFLPRKRQLGSFPLPLLPSPSN